MATEDLVISRTPHNELVAREIEDHTEYTSACLRHDPCSTLTSCHIQFFSICLSHHCLSFPICFGFTVSFYIFLSVLSMFIVKFSRFVPWGSPILGPWALSPRCFWGRCQYPSEVPGGVTWGRFAHGVTWHCIRVCAGHMRRWGYVALHHQMRWGVTWPEVRVGSPSTWGVGVAPPYSKKGSSGSLVGGSPLTRSYKYNWLIDGPNCNCCFGKRYGHGQLDVRGIPYASKRQSMPFSWCWKIFWSEFVHWWSIRSVSITTASEKFLNGGSAREVSCSGRAIPYTSEPSRVSSVVQSVGIAKS